MLGTGSFYHVVFDGTGTIIANGTLYIYGNITINNYFDAGSYVHYIYGNWINNGTFIYGTSTIRFVGSGNILVSPGSFYHVVFASTGTVTATGSLTIYGNVLIENHFNGGAFVHYIYGNWTNNGVYVYGTSTIRFVGTGNILVSASDFYHVVFEGSAQVVASGSLTIFGNITISHYFDAASYSHYVYGKWIVNGTFVYNTSVIVFLGNAVQTIEGAVPANFYGIRVDNVYGILLNVDVNVYYQLWLTLGLITTDIYSVTLYPAADIVGGSATAYINGKLKRGFGSAVAKFFPVGNLTLYRPITFTYMTLTGTSMVEVYLEAGSLQGVPGYITALPRYWAISQSGGSDFTYTVTLDDPDLSNYFGHVRILKCDATITVHATTTPNYTNINVFSTVSCVGLGVEPCVQPDTPVLTPDIDICFGGSATLEILAGNLNDATEWVWYAGECGSNPVGTGPTLMVSPEVTTTYFVRGESGCAPTGLCGSTIVTVIATPEANAGEDGTTCHTSAFVLAGNVANAQSLVWSTSGDGVFDDPTSTSASYMPGEADILAGNVILTLTAQALSPCTTPATSQISLTVNTCHQIVIPAGWSGLSTYVDPVNPAVEGIFDQVVNDLIILQSLTCVYWPGENINTIVNWNTYDGYAIKVANQVDLTITGTRLSDRTLQLSEGWNLIPVLNECETDVDALFAGKGVIVVKEVAGWQLYWPQYGINTLQNLQSGSAYFVLMTDATTITFPGCTKSGATFGANNTNVKMSEMINASPWNSFSPTPNAHLIAITQEVINSSLIRPGDYLGAFDQNGNCFGMIRWEGNSASLALFADDLTTNAKDGFTAGENLYLRMFNVTTGKEYSLDIAWDQQWPNHNGTFSLNDISAVAGLTLGTTEVNDQSDVEVAIYPNPVSDYLFVDLDKPYDVEVSLQDVNGREVLRQSLHDQSNKLDIKSVRAGIYLIKIEGKEFSKIEKITIQ